MPLSDPPRSVLSSDAVQSLIETLRLALEDTATQSFIFYEGFADKPVVVLTLSPDTYAARERVLRRAGNATDLYLDEVAVELVFECAQRNRYRTGRRSGGTDPVG